MHGCCTCTCTHARMYGYIHTRAKLTAAMTWLLPKVNERRTVKHSVPYYKLGTHWFYGWVQLTTGHVNRSLFNSWVDWNNVDKFSAQGNKNNSTKVALPGIEPTTFQLAGLIPWPLGYAGSQQRQTYKHTHSYHICRNLMVKQFERIIPNWNVTITTKWCTQQCKIRTAENNWLIC